MIVWSQPQSWCFPHSKCWVFSQTACSPSNGHYWWEERLRDLVRDHLSRRFFLNINQKFSTATSVCWCSFLPFGKHETFPFIWEFEILKIAIMFPPLIFCPSLTMTSAFPYETVSKIQLFHLWVYMNDLKCENMIFTFYQVLGSNRLFSEFFITFLASFFLLIFLS